MFGDVESSFMGSWGRKGWNGHLEEVEMLTLRAEEKRKKKKILG